MAENELDQVNGGWRFFSTGNRDQDKDDNTDLLGNKDQEDDSNPNVVFPKK